MYKCVRIYIFDLKNQSINITSLLTSSNNIYHTSNSSYSFTCY